VHSNPRSDGVVPLPRPVPGQPQRTGIGGPLVRADRRRLQILAYLSSHQDVKPAYTFEMVDSRDHPSQDARDGFTIIKRMAGGADNTAVVVDAAKLGSPAQRVRAFWTNAARSRTLKQRYGQFKRE
jgi:hypothetical protein